MNGQKVGYARVSAADQNLDRQLAALDGIGMDKVFTDKMTGGRFDRPGLDECRRYLREGDVLHVASIDRLARNLADLQAMITDFQARKIGVRFLKENLEFTGDDNKPMDRLLLQIMGAFAEFERSMIRERQREGIEAARRAGKPMGRPKAISGKRRAELEARLLAGEESIGALAKEYGVSRPTACRIKAEGRKRAAGRA